MACDVKIQPDVAPLKAVPGEVDEPTEPCPHRHPHALFEPSGATFSRFLAAERVRRAVRMLKALPNASVSEIAFRCGFDSLATFYRSFRSITGCAPLDVRSAKNGHR